MRFSPISLAATRNTLGPKSPAARGLGPLSVNQSNRRIWTKEETYDGAERQIAGRMGHRPGPDAGPESHTLHGTGGPSHRWGESARISPTLGGPGAYFGQAVAVDGDTVVVGAWGDDGAATNASAVFIFRRNEGGMDNWGQAARLVPDNAEMYDEFGWAAALDGNVILVGTPNDESATVYREVPFIVYLPLVLRGD